MAKKAYKSLIDSVLPDHRTKGWNRAKWTRIPIISSMLLAYPLGALLSGGKFDSAHSLHWFASFILGAPAAMLITRTILWYSVVRNAEQKLDARKEVKRPKPVQPDLLDISTDVFSITPRDFEHEVAWVFGTLFALQAEVVGAAGDGGIDINLYDRSGMRVAIVQAKKYSRTVPPSALRDLDSCRRRTGVRRAFLVTTGKFSKATHQAALGMKIDLVDGEKYAVLKKQAQEKSAPK
jgi:HJR/Mrr/RecB family endonuclease